MKTKHTLFLVLLSTQMLAITPAKANLLERAKEKLQKAKEISKEKLGQLSESAKETFDSTRSDLKERINNFELPSTNQLEVDDSKVKISINLTNDIQYAYYTLTYNSVKEQSPVFSVKDSQIEFDMGLMKGAGNYKIEVFVTNQSERTSYNYKSIETINVTNSDSEDKKYLLPSLKVHSTHQIIIDLANEITANSQTDQEKVRDLYHWISKNINYNNDVYERWLKQDKDALYGDDEDALFVLETKQATCNGYTNLFASMARALGIKTQIIWGLGNTSKHAWNRVLIDESWVNVDTTWGAAYSKSATPEIYLFTEEATFSKDHRNPVVQENK